MKRTTIYILIISMVITLAGLIILQARYVNINVTMIENQFNESVRRSLFQTVIYVEENEALQYLEQTLKSVDYHREKDNISSFESVSSGLKVSIDSVTKNLSLASAKVTQPKIRLSAGHGKSSIKETSRYLQEKFQQDFSRSKTILDQAVFRWLKESENKDISERVDFEELNYVVEKFLNNNGVDLPFSYSINDKRGRAVFISHKDIPAASSGFLSKNNVYTQRLFPSEGSSHEMFLKVIFPTKQNFILNSMTLLMPSLVLILVVLGIFIMALIIIFRQKQVNTVKNDFVNNMTHELKTPISSISLAAQMLKDPSVAMTPKMFTNLAKVINDESKRLEFIVEKVLQMAIFDKEQSFLKLKDINANKLIAEIVNNFSLKVTNKGGQITSDFKAANDEIFVDEVHFTNVIFNLMDNALKYCGDKPLILSVETWNEKENLCISIEDNGIGIAKDEQKRIFEKFYRVSTGNLHNVKGFGLGLAYVKKIITEHRGTIKIESEIGIGTKFIISIPTITT
ncbi:MAG: HAMP domain-containing histidine kinase [Paludibacter sp.]|jgi:two-component system phosphate regulon sensor histidine kinase PhoR|nr:HAMP domain-containing histidine kinase [Paludibacter sp.]